MKKLNLDENLIKTARELAGKIALDINRELDKFTTTATERAIARLLGVDGEKNGRPYVNILIDYLKEQDLLKDGVAYHLTRVNAVLGLSPQQYSEILAKDFTTPYKDKPISYLVETAKKRINDNKSRKRPSLPLIYLIVATGNIYEDVEQARVAARQGADVIAVIRSTAQSLLDYVPYGINNEGIGGTYATQQNFRLMRQALDEESEKLGRYICLCNYCSGLCMPEIAVMGALEGLDMMLNDALYGILFRDINPMRTLIDQKFSRYINGKAGIIINTGEDNYLTTSDAVEHAPTVLASQFFNEAMANLEGVPTTQQGLGHAFEINPEVENGFLYELAQAQMAREIFPDSPLKYMPPTRYITGDTMQANVQDALFNVVSVVTKQSIHLLGMPTEAIHTPFLSDRSVALKNYRYVYNTMKNLGDEIMFKPDGIIQKRAEFVLNKAVELLKEIYTDGLFNVLEKGKFAGIKRFKNKGRGIDGIIRKSDKYFNPFMEW